MITRRLTLGLSAVACLAACKETTVPPSLPIPVSVAQVETYSGSEGTRYSASIAPNAQVSMAFKSPGYITSVLEMRGADGRMRRVGEGDWVRQGTVLAVVRQDDYRHLVDRASGQLGQAKAAAEKAKKDFDRATALLEAQALTQPDYDAAKSQLDSQNSSVVTAEAALQEAQQSLKDCELRSPLDGWVVNRAIDVGDLAAAGTVGFTLVDTHLVKGVFGVPDTLLSSIRLGQVQGMVTEALPEEFQGRITAISPQADPKSRVFEVEVTIPNPRNRLKAGMVATIDLGQQKLAHPVTVVPLSAIVSPADGSKGFAVFVVTREGERYISRQRRVELGETFSNRVAVLKGIAPGESVIANGTTHVTDGSTVQIIP